MNEEDLLELLKKSRDYISGEQISREMKVSRTCVWKYINKLKARGCKILSSTNRGYLLVDDADLLLKNDLKKECRTKMIGNNIFYYDKCSSTNDMARKGNENGDSEGSVYITDMQHSGRGRLGRTWHFEEKKAIAMSVLLKPVISPSHIMPLSLIAGLCVSMAIEEITGLESMLKWPNDVVVRGKKIAGILIESSIEGEYTKFVILGIGINCNTEKFPDEVEDKAASVFSFTKRNCSRKDIIVRILEIFEKYYFQWIKEYRQIQDFSSASENKFTFVEKYRKKCINIGREVIVEKGESKFLALAKDIDTSGNLVIETVDGILHTVSSGEVSLRGTDGYI